MSNISYNILPTEYIQTDNGNVYKVLENHYLKLSPWKDGEDRRVREENIGDYKVISYKNACMIVNNQFSNTVEKWEHNGKQYLANAIGTNKDPIEHSYLLSTLPSHKIFINDSKRILKQMNNCSLSITSQDGSQEMKLIKHKGKLYYILIVHEFLPRVQAYNMFGEFCQWIGIDKCKPIFNVTDNKYI